MVASTNEPEEREFVVDSGASMHMVREKNLNSDELETMRTSRSPTTEMTANGEVQTKEEATAHVKQLDLFVKVLLLEENPGVLSLEKLCEDHWYALGSAVKNNISSKMARELIFNVCIFKSNYVTCVFLDVSAITSSTTPSSTSPSSSQGSVFDVNRYTENPVLEWKYE